MDVLCVGMYRACSTWQYDVVAHLLERHHGGRRLGYLTGEEYASSGDPEESGRGWRVLKSHEGHRGFAAVLASGRARGVYAHRDLRDVVFSLMHKRGVSFEEIVRQGMVHQILVNDRFWRRQPGVLVQRYEDLIAEPAGGVEQLAAHLGIELATGEAEEIAREYSFQANRKRMLALRARLRARRVDLEQPANSQFYDRQTLLHWNHLREGRAGDWRAEATPLQKSLLARIGNRWLRAHGYETQPAPVSSLLLGELIRDKATISRGWLACALRCLSLRFPDTARIVKSLLRIAPLPQAARPVAVLASACSEAPEIRRSTDSRLWIGGAISETVGV
jgi:hypothetical protein